MSLKSLVIPYLAAAITSPRTRTFRRALSDVIRRVAMKPHVVTVYLRVGDPYSHLLAQVLESFSHRFRVELEIRAVLDLPEEMTPDRARLEAWAQIDAAATASLYDLDPPGEPRSDDDVLAASLALAEMTSVADAAELFADFARGESITPAADLEAAERALRKNERALVSDGHYMSAMLDYGGEWYWGIDRLNHLESRLIDADLARKSGETPRYVRRLELLADGGMALENPPGDPPLLTVYWSARSPYSYLVIARAAELAEAYGVEIDLRPVLPMVMRNLKVPRTKRFYILLDAKREAELLDLPYGRVCDPLGAAVERCYAVIDHIRGDAGADVRFAIEFSRAVWSEGVDGATDKGLHLICERAGLDADACVKAASEQGWRKWAEAHRVEMLAGGFWGVPTMRFGDLWVWGQDRLWMIEAEMRKRGAGPHLAEGDQ